MNARFRRLVCMMLVVWISATSMIQPAESKEDRETERAIRDAVEAPPTPLETVNEFVAHSTAVGVPKPETVTVRNGLIFVRLLTPLNSSFNMSGDVVRAVVVGSQGENGKPWLQEGAILEGCVESAKKATYGQTDGALVIRFYAAKIDNRRVELFTTPDTDDHTLKPSPVHLTTKKQKIRGILMTVTRIAVPAAIGSGGMSIAITAGAGAAIGLAFSEKGKRIQGTVRGAWEGAGLTVFDPIVRKGDSVVLPEGTPLQLQLTETLQAPKYVPNVTSVKSEGELANLQTDASITQLKTHAEIVKNNSTTGETVPITEKVDPLATVNRKILQNDLAAAITALAEAERLYPDDENVRAMHTKIYELVSGQKTSGTESGTTH